MELKGIATRPQLFSAEQVKQLDQALIAAGTPSIVLMKRAAREAFAIAMNTWSDLARVVVFCGPGNNGADGAIFAGLAAQAGLQSGIMMSQEKSHTSGDILRARNFAVQEGVEVLLYSESASLKESCQHTLLVDALLGTGQGSKRALSSDIAELVSMINSGREKAAGTLALDIPTGVHADTGAVDDENSTVNADLTVSFIVEKVGLYTGAGKHYCGQVVLAPLLHSASELDALSSSKQSTADAKSVSLASWEYAKPLLRKTLLRRDDAHKGSFGSALIVGGASGMGGATMLSSRAALRVGAGKLVHACAPNTASASLIHTPEVMAKACESGQHLRGLLEKQSRAFSVLAVGPGLGTESWGQQLFQVATQPHLLEGASKAHATSNSIIRILDADALNLLAKQEITTAEEFNALAGTKVITPHPAEAARLLKTDVETVQADRIAAARLLHKTFGAIVVLKGAGTVVCGEGLCSVIKDGGPVLAVPGSGDVLTGLLAGMLAQVNHADSETLFSTVLACACLHAAAGDHYAAQRGSIGMLASELIDTCQQLLHESYLCE